MTFDEADRKVHPVESQWHYPIMAKHGYAPLDRTGVGFSRAYRYVHPDGHTMAVTTGCNSDYWSDGRHTGLWSTLEALLVARHGAKP